MPIEVQLRSVVEEDLPIFYEHQIDTEAAQMAAFPARDWEPFAAHWHKIMRNQSNFLRTIIYDGLVAGNIVSWDQAGQQMVGYWLGKQFWGKGIATSALLQLIKQVGIRPLYARVSSRNIASMRVLKKCGFVATNSTEKILSSADSEIQEIVLVLNDSRQKINNGKG